MSTNAPKPRPGDSEPLRAIEANLVALTAQAVNRDLQHKAFQAEVEAFISRAARAGDVACCIKVSSSRKPFKDSIVESLRGRGYRVRFWPIRSYLEIDWDLGQP